MQNFYRAVAENKNVSVKDLKFFCQFLRKFGKLSKTLSVNFGGKTSANCFVYEYSPAEKDWNSELADSLAKAFIIAGEQFNIGDNRPGNTNHFR